MGKLSDKSFQIKLGKRLRFLRLEKGMSQQELGLEAGISHAFVGFIENAKKDVTISNLYKISKALDVDITELFDFKKL